MRRSVKVAIEHVGQFGPSKYDEFPVMVVGVKDIDSGAHYKLNLSKKYEKTVNRWLPNIKLGNVLECVLKDVPKNRIDHFAPYKIVEIKEKKVEPKQESALQISLALQLDSIERACKSIREDFNI